MEEKFIMLEERLWEGPRREIIWCKFRGIKGQKMAETQIVSRCLYMQSYHRGTVQSYDRWAELVGDSSYTFANMLRFFRKSVHYSPPNTSLRAANASVPDPSAEAYSPHGGP